MKPTRVFYENLKAFNDGYRLIVNKGSARSSKTFSLGQLEYFIANESAQHKKISIVSQSYPHLRAGYLYDFERMLRTEGIELDNIHNSSKHEITINKSLIEYFSADQTGKVLGPARNILHLNEPNKGISFDTYTHLRQRTDDAIFLDYNPSAPFWLHTEGLLDDPRTKLIHSTWLDNIENISQHQIDDFLDAKRRSKTSPFWDYWWKVYGLGQDAVLMDERIMPILKRASKVPDDAVQIPSALDFGWNPDPSTFLELYIKRMPDGRERLYIKEVLYERMLSIHAQGGNNLTDKLIEKGVNPKHLIIAESASPQNLNDMRLGKFSIEGVKKTTVETSIRHFHSYEIYIVDGSENAYREFDNYRYARDKKTNVILGFPADKQEDHTIDAVRYVLMSRNLRWSYKVAA